MYLNFSKNESTKSTNKCNIIFTFTKILVIMKAQINPLKITKEVFSRGHSLSIILFSPSGVGIFPPLLVKGVLKI